MRRTLLVSAAVIGMLAGFVPAASASHLYRGAGGGCTPATGATGEAVSPAATVMLGHYSYHDLGTALLPVTVISVGDAVQWTWNSAHCHSVTGPAFDSGFHYPTTAPTTPLVNNAYYVPEIAPTLSWTQTFDTPGTFQYSCVHHAGLGMRGVVVVQ